jgi:hypothetical protein
LYEASSFIILNQSTSKCTLFCGFLLFQTNPIASGAKGDRLERKMESNYF